MEKTTDSRGRPSIYGEAVVQLLVAGATIDEVIEKVGCSPQVVHYYRRKMNDGRRLSSPSKAPADGNLDNLMAYLRDHPCVDCDEADPLVLEFDHIDPSTKYAAVTELASRWPWEFVLVEIAKCEVRCANCHKRRTARQLGWKRVQYLDRLEVESPIVLP